MASVFEHYSFMKISRSYVIAGSIMAGILISLASPTDAAAPASAVPPSQILLASHKALYSVTLTGTRPGGDFLDVSGKMILEFTDSCEAWTTNQKSLLRTVSGEGTETLSHSDFSAWETKAGDDYKFSVHQTQDGETSEFRGRARRNPQNDTGTAEYSKPDRRSYKLPPHFLFQTAQQVKLIEFAKKGEHFLSGDMFDGSEGGGAAHFNAVILKPSERAVTKLTDPLLESPSHRVRVAFYQPVGVGDDADGKNASDSNEQPEYEMTMTVHDNGVVSDYDYDYQDFSVHGQLQAIQAMPRPHC